MTGYFDEILDAYVPDNTANSEAPWSDPFDAEAPPDLALPDAPAPNIRDDGLPPSALPEAPADMVEPVRPIFLDTPGNEVPETPQAPDRPADLIIERELRVVEHIAETPDPARPDPAPGPADHAPDIHEHTHIDQRANHLHNYLQIVDDSGFELEETNPAPETHQAPAPPDSGTPPATPDLGAMEAVLANALARLHGEDAPPSPFLSPDDFEPDAPDTPPPPDIDPVREITREVVTEHHHHHTTETRIEPPVAPPPKTAADASRIGPIRFASHWKTGGR